MVKFGLQNDSSARHVPSKASAFCQYASDMSFCARYFSSSFSPYFPYAYTVSMAIAYQVMVVIALLGKRDGCG